MANIAHLLSVIAFSMLSAPAFAAEAVDPSPTPYGVAKKSAKVLTPAKLALEFSTTPDEKGRSDLRQLVNVLKQMQGLLTSTSKVRVVVIGGGIAFFARENYADPDIQAAMDAIQELTAAKVPVEVAYCGNSRKGAGFNGPEELHAFNGAGEEVTGGYPEIDRLVRAEGYVHVMVHDYKTRGARFVFHPELKPATQK